MRFCRHCGYSDRDVRFGDDKQFAKVWSFLNERKQYTDNALKKIEAASRVYKDCQTLLKRGDYKGAEKKAKEAKELLKQAERDLQNAGPGVEASNLEWYIAELSFDK